MSQACSLAARTMPPFKPSELPSSPSMLKLPQADIETQLYVSTPPPHRRQWKLRKVETPSKEQAKDEQQDSSDSPGQSPVPPADTAEESRKRKREHDIYEVMILEGRARQLNQRIKDFHTTLEAALSRQEKNRLLDSGMAYAQIHTEFKISIFNIVRSYPYVLRQFAELLGEPWAFHPAYDPPSRPSIKQQVKEEQQEVETQILSFVPPNLQEQVALAVGVAGTALEPESDTQVAQADAL